MEGEQKCSPFLLLNTHMLKIETMFAKRREKAKERLDICKDCDRYNSVTTQCNVCNCFMKAKTLWPNAECPQGKWKLYEEEKHG
jgi:hypothetical protein